MFGSRSEAAEKGPLPTVFGGVHMGVCLFDFRDLPRLPDTLAYVDTLVDACRQVGAGLVEINARNLEPASDLPHAGIPRLWDEAPTGPPAMLEAYRRMRPGEVRAARDHLRKWRVSTPPRFFGEVRQKFADAGLTPFAYGFTFTPDMSDAEIDAAFRQARALGVRVFGTGATRIEMAPRLVPYAEHYRMDLGFHNHTATQNPNEVASRESLERLLSLSPRVKINLDVGHFTAADQDVMAFVHERLDRISHFHMKDRKRGLGPGTPWGEGDAPLAELLRYVRERGSDVPAIVEYEYRGTGGGVAETRRCFDYMKWALGA
ncbi:MAG: sugar phosphate isomerase/epimerase [Sphingomonas sp.]|uniref:sugar phosphate isomerase/epimerase family protein n=1 Tax=Sphingomonas sp. TaxID=28214 RepID=UPI0025F5CBD9|nr:sugar phosphate isomerase/epimerase [Sphingomonas sp.]MBX3563581.1 sugar phosphate isomerase/epimerase [Sphingomonas sp.]